MSVGILGAGKALGSRIHSNEELARTAGVSPSWVLEKCGIQQRHYVEKGETTSSLAVAAARQALLHADVCPEEIGMVVACTFTADYLFPPLSAKLHHDLGCGKACQFYDLAAACSGYVSALTAVSDRMLADSSIKYALVVGADVLSPYVNPADPETAMFFSDGAGAVVLGRTYGGIVSSAFSSDTSSYEAVRCKRDGLMEMNGIVTWKQAVTHLPAVVREAMSKVDWDMDCVDLVILHQANAVLIRYLANRLKIPPEKTFINVDTTGNTGAASIPIAIADAGKLALYGNLVVAGIGAGYGFAASCWEWS